VRRSALSSVRRFRDAVTGRRQSESPA